MTNQNDSLLVDNGLLLLSQYCLLRSYTRQIHKHEEDYFVAEKQKMHTQSTAKDQVKSSTSKKAHRRRLQPVIKISKHLVLLFSSNLLQLPHAHTPQAKHAGNTNAHPFIVPGRPAIPGRPGTRDVAGSEGISDRLGIPVTWDTTSAFLSAGGVAAGARVGATRVEGVVLG